METNLAESERADYFKTVMEILIAVVALVIALSAWRGSLAARSAGFEDYYALTATLQDQDAKTKNATQAYQHLGAFTLFAANHTLFKTLSSVAAQTQESNEKYLLEFQMEQADKLARSNRNLFPARFINRQGDYELTREMAEEYADAQRRADLDPEPHLARSNAFDLKTFGMTQMVILLSIALFAFTLASVLHADRRFLRWAVASVGVVAFGVSLVGIVLTELA